MLIIAGLLGITTFLCIVGLALNLYNYQKTRKSKCYKYIKNFLLIAIIAQFILAFVNILRGEAWSMNAVASVAVLFFYLYGLEHILNN